MEVFAIADAVAVTTTHSIGFDNFILRSNCCNSFTISAVISAVIAPPVVRSNTYRAAPRSFTRQRRRTKRRTFTGDCEDGGEEDGFFGAGDDGPFGGGRSGGSGGRGWNFDGFDSEESSYSSYSDHALDFIYEVICWIALSNCIHFAFKKLVRIVADGIGDPSRNKVPMRLVSIC